MTNTTSTTVTTQKQPTVNTNTHEQYFIKRDCAGQTGDGLQKPFCLLFLSEASVVSAREFPFCARAWFLLRDMGRGSQGVASRGGGDQLLRANTAKVYSL